MRLLAYCLEHTEGITFAEELSSTEEPAVVVRERIRRLTGWIKVGAPDAARLHDGSKFAERAVVYTHRDPGKVMAPWACKKIGEASAIEILSFDQGFSDAVMEALERRNAITASVTERQLHLKVNGGTLSSVAHDQRLASRV